MKNYESLDDTGHLSKIHLYFRKFYFDFLVLSFINWIVMGKKINWIVMGKKIKNTILYA